MSKEKHTPGPWSLEEASMGFDGLYGPDNEIIFALAYARSDERPEAECQANARLMCAAPDLLAACQEFVRKVEAGEARSVRSYEQMKAAIKKATAQ